MLATAASTFGNLHRAQSARRLPGPGWAPYAAAMVAAKKTAKPKPKANV